MTPIESMLAERARARRKTPLELAAREEDPTRPPASPSSPTRRARAAAEGELVRGVRATLVSGLTPRTVAELVDLRAATARPRAHAGGRRRARYARREAPSPATSSQARPSASSSCAAT